jgi:hypothetical protein
MVTNDEHEPITVRLSYKPWAERRLRPFYCVRCGKCVCEITGDATEIIPGAPNDEEIGELDIAHHARCGGNIRISHGVHVRCTATYYFN